MCSIDELSDVTESSVINAIDVEYSESTDFPTTQIIEALVRPFFDALNTLADCFFPVNEVTQEREFRYLPKKAEVLLGRIMYPSLCFNEGGAITHLYSEKITEITKNLAQHTKRHFDYEVVILGKNTINAWCLPGGKMAVYSLLLEKISFYVNNKDSLGLQGYTDPKTGTHISYEDVTVDDVIAALLGHEMTHADARHAARKLEFSFVIQALIFGLQNWTSNKLQAWNARIVESEKRLGTDQGFLKKERDALNSWKKVHTFIFNYFNRIALQLYFMFESRTHELEADEYGTLLAKNAGYNPAGALFLQDILKREALTEDHYLPQALQEIKNIFSSHPTCSERQDTIYPIVRDWQQITPSC